MLPKKSIIFLTIILLVCSGFLIYLYFQSQQLSQKVSDVDKKTKQIVNFPGNPIKKSILENKDGIIYRINGQLVNKPVSRPDGAYNAKMIIKGDEMQRQIPIVMGLGSRQIFLEKYSKSPDVKATWNLVPVADAVAEVKPNEDMVFDIRLYVPVKGEDSSYFENIQAILDEVASEFNRNSYTLKLPIDFALVIEKIEITR
jgi:hypothetical protein